MSGNAAPASTTPRRAVALTAAALTAATLLAFTLRSPLQAAAAQPAVPPYAPGLGEIMTLTQMRHAKLWLAGQAGNWELADYELDELGEGFDDAALYHPTHKTAAAPIKDLLAASMREPLAELRAAIRDKNGQRFVAAYDTVTAGCNACHRAAGFGFNVVTRPSGNPYTNQDFSAPH